MNPINGEPPKHAPDRAPDAAVPGAIARRAGYAAALCVAAAGSLILEIVGGRMLAPYVGMSLYTWTAIIAVVLTGLSIGHWIGGHLADRDESVSLRTLVASFWLAGLTALASLPLLRLASGPILSAGLGPVLSIVVLTAVLFLLPVLFSGIAAPVLTRMALTEAPHRRGRVLGQMYAVGALGSIAGTLAAGFLFISWIGSAGTIIVVAAGYGLTGALLLLRRPARRGIAASAGVAAIAAMAITAAGIGIRAFDSPCFRESDYYCIRVVDFAPQTGRASALLVLDHLGHGINDRDDPTRLHSSYVELADRLFAQRLSGRDTFAAYFIGGGAYTVPRAWQAAYPKADLVVAEIDPAVTRTATERLWLQPAEKMRILHKDARVALQALPAQPTFDLVLGDAFRDISIPQHLVTAEFAREIAARMRPGGLYTLNVVDAAEAPRFLFSMVRTLRTAFATVEVWGDRDQLAAGGHTTFLVVASDQPTANDRLTSPHDPARRWLRWPEDDLRGRIEASAAPLLTDDYAPVDRLMIHVQEDSG